MIRSIKGTHDILPQESAIWQKVENNVRNIMGRYGYSEIRTPAFEGTELFNRAVGEDTDIVSKEMYTWTDQSGTSLTLKPELTAPVVRAFIQHNLSHQNPLQKLYYIDALFRRERPQKGRFRQFHQFGIEVFGAENPEIDAEVISLAFNILKELGLSSLNLIINSIGSKDCLNNYRNLIRDFLKPHFKELSETSQKRFHNNPLRILDTKIPREIEILQTAPSIANSLSQADSDHFSKVCEYLEILKIPFKVDDKLVRGLDYYSRTTFEITSDSLGAQNALCGGGRYDDLVESLGGKSTPGIGFAAGLERIIMVLEDTELKSEISPAVYMVGLGSEAVSKTMGLTQALRNRGLTVLFDPLRRSLKGQLREAHKLGVKIAVIVGDNELNNGKALVKDLTSGSQQGISLDRVV
ncbi:MAG: histidine--tRNA ligase [Candidatus Neomarinimicrobiota bacterium]